MLWQKDWNNIETRATEIKATGDFLVTIFQKNDQDPNGLSGAIIGQIKFLNKEFKKFAELYNGTIPVEAIQAINEYLQKENTFNYVPGSPMHNLSPWLLKLTLVVSEVNYYLANISEVIKRQSERAFLHLQQSIAAAEDIQQRWQKAFNEGETACEKLGAAHLLQHGIYAFKAHGTGARTDLVFPDRPFSIDDVQRTADGLVLTEWKKVKTQKEAAVTAEHARQQAALYKSGILGGIELANYRYIVLVSEKKLNTPDDTEENGIIYRHINIAVEPLSPSKAAWN